MIEEKTKFIVGHHTQHHTYNNVADDGIFAQYISDPHPFLHIRHAGVGNFFIGIKSVKCNNQGLVLQFQNRPDRFVLEKFQCRAFQCFCNGLDLWPELNDGGFSFHTSVTDVNGEGLRKSLYIWVEDTENLLHYN